MKNSNGFISMALGLIIVFLAIAIAEYSYFHPAYAPITPAAQNASSSSSSIEIPYWKTFHDTEFGDSLQYPPDFTLTEEPGQSITLVVPVKNYFHTQLTSEASLTINNPAPTCPVSDGEKSAGPVSTPISSPAGTFQKISFSDVGAGQLYDTSEYKLNKDGNCYQLTLLIHSANGAGFYYSDPDQIASVDKVQADDKAAFSRLIDRVVSTFTINK